MNEFIELWIIDLYITNLINAKQETFAPILIKYYFKKNFFQYFFPNKGDIKGADKYKSMVSSKEGNEEINK